MSTQHLSSTLSSDPQTKSYDTSFNRFKYILALVILRNKPVDWTIEEYIRFVNCNDVQQQKTLNEITQMRVGDNNNDRKQTDQELSDNKNNIIDDSELRWRKRAFELTNEVESLKQQLCVTELELENAKQNTTTSKRKKTKAQQTISPGTTEGNGNGNSIKKQSDKRTFAKRGSKKYQDPYCQVFQNIQGTDNEIWRQFDINQAMSFLQQVKIIMPTAVNSASAELPSSKNSGVVISQTIIKIVCYMNIKLTSLLELIRTNASKNDNLKRTYTTCVNNFSTVLKKLIVFLESPLLSKFEKGEILSTIATSFASLIKAIHVLTIQKNEELVQENNETEDVIDEPSKIPLGIQDPRDAIACALIHICNEIEPKLKETVCFVATKECLRLVTEEFRDSTTKDTKFSINETRSNIGISSGTLHGETDSETVIDAEIKSIACKDTTYYLLWILEEILVNNQGCQIDNEILPGEAIKNITTLLEASLLNNKQDSIHGDAFTMYLCNICEKLWLQLGVVSFMDLFEKLI